MLRGKNIVLGVTGGIAAYKAVDLASRLVKQGAQIDVIMTAHAQEFVRPLTFASIVNSPVVTDMFAQPLHFDIEHIALAKKADLFVIAPATANIIAKLAHGIADDSLSTTILATKAPVLICPAMNTQMYHNPVTQENMDVLRRRGFLFVAPAEGRLACGDIGAGKLADVSDIEQRIVFELLRSGQMEGYKVLVTAGPTVEPIDPVRSITNRSSGKMGYAFAMHAARMGADVTLVSGPTQLPAPYGVKRIDVRTTQEMFDRVMEHADADFVIMAAAPGDFRVALPSDQKIKKNGAESISIELVANPDILKTLGEKKRRGQTLVGFAAETEQLIANARKKLEAKGADYIVANDVSREGAGFDVDTNIVTLISSTEALNFEQESKTVLARRIWEILLENR